MIRHVLAKDSSNIVKIYNHYIKNSTISFEESPVSPKEIEHRVYKVLNSNPPWLVHESTAKSLDMPTPLSGANAALIASP